MVGPENRNVRLGCRAEICKRVQHAIAALGHQRAPVQIHTADALCRPITVSAEQRVVIGRSQKADYAKLLDQLIPELLSLAFVQNSLLKIPFDVDVEEARYPADGHCCPVRLLDRPQIGKVGPLECLLSIASRLRYIEAI